MWDSSPNGHIGANKSSSHLRFHSTWALIFAQWLSTMQRSWTVEPPQNSIYIIHSFRASMKKQSHHSAPLLSLASKPLLHRALVSCHETPHEPNIWRVGQMPFLRNLKRWIAQKSLSPYAKLLQSFSWHMWSMWSRQHPFCQIPFPQNLQWWIRHKSLSLSAKLLQSFSWHMWSMWSRQHPFCQIPFPQNLQWWIRHKSLSLSAKLLQSFSWHMWSMWSRQHPFCQIPFPQNLQWWIRHKSLSLSARLLQSFTWHMWSMWSRQHPFCQMPLLQNLQCSPGKSISSVEWPSYDALLWKLCSLGHKNYSRDTGCNWRTTEKVSS